MVVVTKGGMLLGNEVYAGNRSDVTTVEEIVDSSGQARIRGGWVVRLQRSRHFDGLTFDTVSSPALAGTTRY